MTTQRKRRTTIRSQANDPIMQVATSSIPGLPDVERGHVPLGDLVPNPDNPRVIDDQEAAGLCRSIERFGLVQEIVVDRRSGQIVGGHQRVQALRAKDLRVFYTPKADGAERDAGCMELEPKTRAEMTNRKEGSAGSKHARAGAGTDTGRRNTHSTVKPIDLMRYLMTLVTPPGGVVLDPFTGSGTTGIACMIAGARFIGMEREAKYVKIAHARLTWWAEQCAKGEAP